MEFNYVSAWLYIIGNQQRAKKLRKLIDKLPQRSWDEKEQQWLPAMCPTGVLFGAKEAEKLYHNAGTRLALDAWDAEWVTKDEIKSYCRYIEAGRYRGPVYDPRRKRERMAQ